MTITQTLEPVEFSLPGDDKLKPRWNVVLQEDGSLMVTHVGRRSGSVLVEPRAQNCIGITSTSILETNVPKKVVTALKDCVMVLKYDLEAPSVARPEIREGVEALAEVGEVVP